MQVPACIPGRPMPSCAAMENRQRILDAAARVYGEAGFRGATTRRIAAEAGVNEVTLFRIFGSKASLLAEAVQCCASPAEATPFLPDEPRDPERELAVWATQHLAHLHRNAPLIRTMLGELEEHPDMASTVSVAPRRAHKLLRDYLGRLRRGGWIDADVSIPAAASMLVGTLFADVMGRALMPDLLPQPEQGAARQYVRLFVGAIGLRTPANAPRKRRDPIVRSEGSRRTDAPARPRSKRSLG